MLAQLIKFKSTLTEDEAMAIARERAPEFRAIPSLVQKYYLKLGEPNCFAGFYIWDSAQALAQYRQSELAKTIPSAYRIEGAPEIMVGEVMFPLRN